MLIAQMIPASAGFKKPMHTRIAVLGCHRQFEPAPALFRYIEANPELCLWIGDNVYADTKDDPEHIAVCYEALASKPEFRMLRETGSHMVTWDDHDYGYNNAGKEYVFKQRSRELFLDFWNLNSEIPSDRDGVYYSKIFKYGKHELQVIMLDVRYNRDLPDTDGDILGELQWEWLEEQLDQNADLRFIVSGSQVLLDKESGSETWENYPRSQKRLFSTIRDKHVNGVLFITGDQHYGEVGRLREALGYDAIELQFSGINQNEGPEYNSYRVSNVSRSKHSYALIDIQWEKSEEEIPHLMFSVLDGLTDQIELRYRVNLNELKNN